MFRNRHWAVDNSKGYNNFQNVKYRTVFLEIKAQTEKLPDNFSHRCLFFILCVTKITVERGGLRPVHVC